MKRLSVIVSGRVQGVSFRFYTKETAVTHHLTGWVQNAFNGDVEMEVQGDEKALDIFMEKVKLGPPLSDVRNCRVKEIPLEKDETVFRIRH